MRGRSLLLMCSSLAPSLCAPVQVHAVGESAVWACGSAEVRACGRVDWAAAHRLVAELGHDDHHEAREEGVDLSWLNK